MWFHENGVVHRDLKPKNVLRFGRAWKLTDFGIAKNTTRPITVRTFQRHGTPGYAAPEQFQGVMARPSADVYSLGKVLVFLITAGTDVDLVTLPAWNALVKRCIHPVAEERPPIDVVIKEARSYPHLAFLMMAGILGFGRGTGADGVLRVGFIVRGFGPTRASPLYAHGGGRGTMTLAAVEFVRRFLMHVLPTGFVRVRHYGLLANRRRQEKLAVPGTARHGRAAAARQGPDRCRSDPARRATKRRRPRRGYVPDVARVG